MGTRRSLPTLVGLLVVLSSLPLATPVAALSPNVVISQVFGGGGNTGAPYQSDFIELFNRGGSAVSLTGWSIQYAATTGSNWSKTDLTAVTLQPGQYYLVKEATGTSCGGLPCGVALPAADVTGSIAMGSGAGKVALVSGATLIPSGTVCPIGGFSVVDFIGYANGTTCFEGSSPASGLSNTTSAIRRTGGCMETDENLNDFQVAAPNPRNTDSPLAPCDGPPPTPTLSINDVAQIEGNSGTTAFTFTVSLSASAPAGGVTFDIATADGTAQQPGDYMARSLTGQSITAGNTSYSFTVDVNGDVNDEGDETFLVNVSNVTGATTGDTQGQGTILDDDSCGLTFTPIYQIQGSGMSVDPDHDGNVTTEGVVVGDFEGPTSTGLQGFYMQDATGDGDVATSDGIFVFTGNTDNGLAVGDLVRVTGFGRERFEQTALNGSDSNSSAVTNIIECGTASLPGPLDVTLPVTAIGDFEKYEGMRVRFPQALQISEYFNYDRFGEMVLALPLPGEGRPFTPTLLEEPGSPGYAARLSANQRSRIMLDDGRGAGNPSSVRHPNGDPFSLSNRFRGGDTVENTVGVLGFDFSVYRIQPTADADYTQTNPRPASPANVGGRIQVASMNTLNYFLTPDAIPTDDPPAPNNPADDVCGGNTNLDCRGHDAGQPNELSRQRVKLLAALNGLGAEVIGLNELENTPGVDPLADIVAGLNAMPGNGPGTWAYINAGVIGTDAIRVGLIYKPAAVTPVGAFQILNTADDPRFIDTLNRPVLAQTFRENATGAVFTVAVNHLKSKNPAPACLPDSGDGQGSCSEVREAAAQALVDWLATDPTGSGDPDFLITGDLNSYAMEDPIDAVRNGADDTPGTGDDYTNLIAQYAGAHAYSFVFDGMAGYLDHALATSSLTVQVTGATEWHINADEPDILDYDTSFKPAAVDALYEPNAYRSSDHDPVLVGLSLTPNVGSVTGTGAWEDGSFDISVLFNPGNDVPTGSTILSVPDGTLVSSGYDWLSLTNNRATFQGVGAFNGTAGYGFLVAVVDGGTPGTKDRLRVLIWDALGEVVYDSQPGDAISAAPTEPLTSGNLTVHKVN